MGRRSTTKDDAGKWALTPQQEAAVDLLATGQTITDTAAAVGVSRQTVSGWLNHNHGFQAALHERQRELWCNLSDRLRGLMPKALATVESALDAGDLKTAVAVLRLAAVPLRPNGSTNAEDLEAEATKRKAERKLDTLLGHDRRNTHLALAG